MLARALIVVSTLATAAPALGTEYVQILNAAACPSVVGLPISVTVMVRIPALRASSTGVDLEPAMRRAASSMDGVTVSAGNNRE